MDTSSLVSFELVDTSTQLSDDDIDEYQQFMCDALGGVFCVVSEIDTTKHIVFFTIHVNQYDVEQLHMKRSNMCQHSDFHVMWLEDYENNFNSEDEFDDGYDSY
jgi:hypothetical protein